MDQNSSYSYERLTYLISQASIEPENKNLQVLQQRKPVRESLMRYQIQEDIIKEQYEQSLQYQEKILMVYRSLQSMENINCTNQYLLTLFEDDDMIVSNTAEQCIAWYYRTQNQSYIQLLILIFENHPDILESIQKKIMKDIKTRHQFVYRLLKKIKSILEDNFIKMIYQNLLIQYSFCYIYDFKNSQEVIKSIYELVDLNENQQVESEFLLRVYQNQLIVMQEIENLSKDQLYQGLIYSTLYLLPKLQFNTMFQNRVAFNFNVQIIDKQEYVKMEIENAINKISNDNMIESFLPTFIINKPELASFILNKFMERLIQNKNNQKILQQVVSLVGNAELKQLYFQNNKKKSLMRETLLQIQEDRFNYALGNNENSLIIIISLCNFYKNGLQSKPQLLIYTKLLIKQLLTIYIESKISVKQISLLFCLEEIKKCVECINKAKDHEQQLIREVFQKIISIQKLNWFDLENIITFDTLCFIIDVIKEKLA